MQKCNALIFLVLTLLGLTGQNLVAQVGTPQTSIQFSTSTSPTGPLGQSAGPTSLFGDITNAAANWAALGTAPFPAPPAVAPYGLRLQRSGQFSVFNLVENGSEEDLVVGWGQSGGKLRMRYVTNQIFGTFEEIMTLSDNSNVGIGFTEPNSYEKLRVQTASLPNPISPFPIKILPAVIVGEYLNSADSRNVIGVRGESDLNAGRGYGGYFSGGQFGVYGRASTTGTGNRYGVYAFASASSATNIYGVYAAVSGTASGNKFAGFFNGDVYAANFTTILSDRKFKTNVEPEIDAIGKIMQLNPATYTYKQAEYEAINLPDGLGHGFIAQELETVFPEMVHAVSHPILDEETGEQIGNEDFKAIKYTALIPVLTKAIQEQQQQIEALTEQLAALQDDKPATPQNSNWESQSSLNLEGIRLYQNSPNPFSIGTEIRVEIPQEVNNATLYVYDLQGKPIQEYPIATRGNTYVSVPGYDLNEGMYIYSLIVDGKVIDSKRMILTK